MIRLGAEPSKMREIELDDVFLSRLQLLIIMSKAYLSGYPLGRHRIKSILENAHHVKVDAVGLEEDLEWFEQPGTAGIEWCLLLQARGDELHTDEEDGSSEVRRSRLA